MYSPVDKLTSQNYDLQFGTNVLGTQRGKPYKARSHPQTCDDRPLLFYQASPPSPTGDSRKGSREDRACGQCELSCPLLGIPKGHRLEHAQARGRVT